MPGERYDTGDWLAENIPHFLRCDELATTIGQQNDLYGELVESGAVSIEPFQDLAAEYLAVQQETHFAELVKEQAADPYGQFHQRETTLTIDLKDLGDQISLLDTRYLEEADTIHSQEALVAARIPQLASQLSVLAAQLEAGLRQNEKESLESQRALLQTEHVALLEVDELTSRPWPIPRLVSRRPAEVPFLDREALDGEGDIVEIDQFPEDKRTLTKEEIAALVRRRYSPERLKDASEFVGLLLAEVPKHVFLADDLGEVIYDNNIPRSTATNRARALISNYELGKTKIIGQVLDENKLAFERGKRDTYYRHSGQRVGRSHPVFRAVPIEEVGTHERIVRVSEYDQKIDVVDNNWRSIVYGGVKRTPVPVTSEPQLDDGWEASPPTPPQPNEEPTSPAESPEPKWAARFGEAITEAIATLEADGLMVDGEISRATVRRKSSSKSMGTETMAHLAAQNGILSRTQIAPDVKLPTAIFVSMALQNTHQELFAARATHKPAMQMVEDTVAAYFAAKQKRRRR